jgi:hypothetical protein
MICLGVHIFFALEGQIYVVHKDEGRICSFRFCTVEMSNRRKVDEEEEPVASVCNFTWNNLA